MDDKIVGACRKCGEPIKTDKWDNRECRNGCEQYTAQPTGAGFLSLAAYSSGGGIEGGGSTHFRAGTVEGEQQ